MKEEVNALRSKLKEAKEAVRKREEAEASLRQELEEAKESLAVKTKDLLRVSEVRNSLQKKVVIKAVICFGYIDCILEKKAAACGLGHEAVHFHA